NSSLPRSSLGGNGCRNTSANSPRTAANAGQRHNRDFRTVSVSSSSEATKEIESHTGGSGTRQSGSQRTCQLATFSAQMSSTSAIAAAQCQPVKIAKNPIGTTNESSGTMSTFADRPENEMR